LVAVTAFVLTAYLIGYAQAAMGREILIVDAKSQPESLTLTPDGTLIVGSASSPFIYKVRPGSTTAEKFVDASTEGVGTFFFGMLADASTNTLWACQLTPVPGTTPARRHTVLRSFDLSTAAPKLRWVLPGDNNVCNDFSIGPDRALYITDTSNGRIYKLRSGAATAELFLEDYSLLHGIDGITFLDGTLYLNNVITSKIYRVPVDAAGKAGQPVEVLLDQPIKGPDGMRATKGKLLLAENASGKIDVITVSGDKASVKTVVEGLNTPTGVEPAGDVIWIAERGAGKAVSVAMPK